MSSRAGKGGDGNRGNIGLQLQREPRCGERRDHCDERNHYRHGNTTTLAATVLLGRQRRGRAANRKRKDRQGRQRKDCGRSLHEHHGKFPHDSGHVMRRTEQRDLIPRRRMRNSETVMAKVTAFEAKTRFGELLNRVAEGEELSSPVMASRWRVSCRKARGGRKMFTGPWRDFGSCSSGFAGGPKRSSRNGMFGRRSTREGCDAPSQGGGAPRRAHVDLVTPLTRDGSAHAFPAQAAGECRRS